MTDNLGELIDASNPSACVYKFTHQNKDGRKVHLYSHNNVFPNALPDELSLDASSNVLRWHPLRREWNIYAPGRQNRTFKPTSSRNPLAASKPGCFPTEIPFERFEVAVFENRFPSLSGMKEQVNLYTNKVVQKPAFGRCEVVVYGPDEEDNLGSLPVARRRLLVEAWIDRYKDAFDSGFEYVLPFENRGDEVGVTLSHPHGQIYAFDFVPPVQEKAVRGFADGFSLSENLTSWADHYSICQQDSLVAFCPPFARFPFEVWIASKRPVRGLWDFDGGQREAFADLLGWVSRRYDQYFGRSTPYMLSLHSAPLSYSGAFEFTAQFYPLLRTADKLKYLASVEQSTGVFTIDVMPEWAASELKG